MIQTLDKSDICPAKPIYTNEFGLFRLNAPEYKLRSERLSHIIMYCSFNQKKQRFLEIPILEKVIIWKTMHWFGVRFNLFKVTEKR